MTQIMTNGISKRMLPMMPPIIIRGRKAAMVVIDEAVTGASIRSAPPTAARRELSPI